MQWDDVDERGLQQGKPWLPVPPSYTTVNVKAEEQIPTRCSPGTRA